jgi:hypothetical protein
MLLGGRDESGNGGFSPLLDIGAMCVKIKSRRATSRPHNAIAGPETECSIGNATADRFLR